jgi:hypothetical protein
MIDTQVYATFLISIPILLAIVSSQTSFKMVLANSTLRTKKSDIAKIKICHGCRR